MTWLRRWAGMLMPLLLAAGLLALGFAAYQIAASRTYQNDQRNQFRHIKEDSRLTPAAPIPPG